MGTIVNIKKRIISDRPNDNGKNAEKDNQTDNIGEKVVYQLGDIGTITVDRGEWIDVVGADDLPVFSIDEMLIKEKASMLLKGKFLEEDRDFLDKIMEKDLMRSKVSPQIEYKYQNVISSDPSKINELSFIDEWIYNDDFSNMEDVYRSLQMEPSPYSDYSLGNAFTIVPLPLSERNQLDFCSKVTDFFDYQKNLDKIVDVARAPQRQHLDPLRNKPLYDRAVDLRIHKRACRRHSPSQGAAPPQSDVSRNTGCHNARC